jgi:uncharacterized membrane protein
MKSTFVAITAVALFVITGCNNGTTGGPGADKAKAQEKESKVKQTQDKISQPEDTFSLHVPTLSTKVKQGETKVVTIGIKRGKNFDQNVELKLDGVPTGVTVDPAAPAIKHGDKDVAITFKAADDAALGDFTIKVTGHPAKGTDATNDLKITVQKK